MPKSEIKAGLYSRVACVGVANLKYSIHGYVKLSALAWSTECLFQSPDLRKCITYITSLKNVSLTLLNKLSLIGLHYNKSSN